MNNGQNTISVGIKTQVLFIIIKKVLCWIFSESSDEQESQDCQNNSLDQLDAFITRMEVLQLQRVNSSPHPRLRDQIYWMLNS